MAKRIRAGRLLAGALVLAAGAAALFPILFILCSSLMDGGEVAARYSSEMLEGSQGDFVSHGIHFVRFGLVPSHPTFGQYAQLADSPDYLRMFWNSLLIAGPVLAGQCLIAPLAAYGFENFQWRGKEALYFMYIVIMLMPTQLLLVPNFIVAGWFGLEHSYLAIILPSLFHPLGVFLIRQQLKAFPKEALEAAALDGAGPYQAYRHIVRPNLSSVVAAMLVLLFADNWNIVDQAVIFLEQSFENPLSVYLGSVATGDPGMFFAASVFYLIPALLVFLLGQEYLTEGIALSGLKA